MSPADEEFLRQLRATFKVEAAEHLQAIAAGLLELEKTPDADAQQAIDRNDVPRGAQPQRRGARRRISTRSNRSASRSRDLFAAWKRAGKRARRPRRSTRRTRRSIA